MASLAESLEELSIPVNITKVIDFQPEGRYLFVVRLDNDQRLPEAQLAYLNDQIRGAFVRVLGGSVQFAVLLTEQPLTIEAYQFRTSEGEEWT